MCLVVVDAVLGECLGSDVLLGGGDFDVDVAIGDNHCDGFYVPSASDAEASELIAPVQCCFAVTADFVGRVSIFHG